jgi:CRP-like cAMP-binding protein
MSPYREKTEPAAANAPNLFVRKLASFGGLSAEDIRDLALASSDIRRLPADDVITAEGDTPTRAHAVIEGFACRYKTFPDGTRQIVDFLVPGDLCDGHALFLAAMDHTVGTLSPCLVAYVPHKVLLDLTETHPAIARVLWWSALVQESIAREWIGNIGRRAGEQRLGHLVCELCFRLDAVGLGHEGRYNLPLTQTDLADAIGFSTVHTNRTLQKLRKRGLLSFEGGTLVVVDLPRLEALSGFDRTYLHPRSDAAKRPS